MLKKPGLLTASSALEFPLITGKVSLFSSRRGILTFILLCKDFPGKRLDSHSRRFSLAGKCAPVSGVDLDTALPSSYCHCDSLWYEKRPGKNETQPDPTKINLTRWNTESPNDQTNHADNNNDNFHLLFLPVFR